MNATRLRPFRWPDVGEGMLVVGAIYGQRHRIIYRGYSKRAAQQAIRRERRASMRGRKAVEFVVEAIQQD